jgi:hypothetical protein
MPMKKTDLAELNRKVEELHRQQREESKRELEEIFARSGFKNGADALQAFRDLFDSDQEERRSNDGAASAAAHSTCGSTRRRFFPPA